LWNYTHDVLPLTEIEQEDILQLYTSTWNIFYLHLNGKCSMIVTYSLMNYFAGFSYWWWWWRCTPRDFQTWFCGVYWHMWNWSAGYWCKFLLWFFDIHFEV
jgi:hypothetical protein